MTTRRDQSLHPDALDRAIRRLWMDTAMPAADIARRLGISADTLRNRRKAMGLPNRPPLGPSKAGRKRKRGADITPLKRSPYCTRYLKDESTERRNDT